MSGMRSNQSKRKRRQDKVEGSSSDEADGKGGKSSCTSFRRWLDEGRPQSDGTIDHDLLGISVGDENFVINLGDSVLLRVSQKEVLEKRKDTAKYFRSSVSNPDFRESMVARIERMWEEPSTRKTRQQWEAAGVSRNNNVSHRLKIQARWFLRQSDALAVEGEFIAPTSQEDFLNKITSHDLLLSNLTDENYVTSISGACHVIYRQPDDDAKLPKMPFNSFVCRYSLLFGGHNNVGKVVVTPYAGLNDDWSLLPASEQTRAKRRRHAQGAGLSNTSTPHREAGSDGMTQSMSSDDSNSVGSDGFRKPVTPEAEGSTEKRDIRVGPEHQAIVPNYVSNQSPKSRKPTLVWQAGKMSTSDLENYFQKVASVLTPYLKQNRLTPTDPYSPLSSQQIETVIDASSGAGPTVSSICTASSLLTQRNHIFRECDMDSLLAVLQQKDYSVNAALTAIEASPRDFLTVWSPEEKELFNSGFRRYSGSLRMISRGIAPSKSFKDVIDYHYRFKIPDQFRRFQEKKREQAVRMMECIETRRYMNYVIPLHSDRGVAYDSGGTKRTKPGEWARTGIADVTGSTEQRRIKAKQLLLEVEEKIGKEKMAEIADAIKRLHQQSAAELKVALVQVLKEHTDLLKRFIDFLPMRLRR